jgi:pimeloyl-ACP methyl ester carboxylesterase
MTVIFVHHFGGNAGSTRRHQELVASLGLPFKTFSLSPFRFPGTFDRWTAELAQVCAATPGPKIFYSLSFPSCLVPRLNYEERRDDIAAWICDGGPFLEGYGCLRNYYTYHEPTPGFRRELKTFSSYLALGGPFFADWAEDWLSAWDPSVPILSLRSKEDRLVPESAIDAFFALNPKLEPRKVHVHGDHLEGIKANPDLYRREVSDFLRDGKTFHGR